MNARSRGARGFTLIELLVVIAIIGVLAAVLLPSIAGAMRSAKRARAMGQMRDLDAAIKRYFAEYNRMPVPRADMIGGADKSYAGGEQAMVIRVLINDPTLDPALNLNPKQQVFLDLDPSVFGVKTVETMMDLLVGGTPYPDPWGNPYGILMDLNFDNKVVLGGWPEIAAKVGVYSLGEPEKGYTTATTPFRTW